MSTHLEMFYFLLLCSCVVTTFAQILYPAYHPPARDTELDSDLKPIDRFLTSEAPPAENPHSHHSNHDHTDHDDYYGSDYYPSYYGSTEKQVYNPIESERATKEPVGAAKDSSVCKEDQFLCSTAILNCIPRSWVCDSHPDCPDGSDEDEFCPEEDDSQFAPMSYAENHKLWKGLLMLISILLLL